MEQLIAELVMRYPIIMAAIMLLGGLVLVATAITRMTKSKKDDELVDKAASWLFKVLAFLPTLGINPRTKKLEEYYEETKIADSKDNGAA